MLKAKHVKVYKDLKHLKEVCNIRILFRKLHTYLIRKIFNFYDQASKDRTNRKLSAQNRSSRHNIRFKIDSPLTFDRPTVKLNTLFKWKIIIKKLFERYLIQFYFLFNKISLIILKQIGV